MPRLVLFCLLAGLSIGASLAQTKRIDSLPNKEYFYLKAGSTTPVIIQVGLPLPSMIKAGSPSILRFRLINNSRYRFKVLAGYGYICASMKSCVDNPCFSV